MRIELKKVGQGWRMCEGWVWVKLGKVCLK